MACTACDLVEGCSAPVPWSGPVPAAVAVLGEAPGAREDEAGAPFVGPAGALLRRYLERVGMDPTALAFVNTVCCFPGRAPTAGEVAACSQNLSDQFALLSPRFVLVLGGTALQALRPGAMITAERGEPWNGDGRTYFPTWHPAAVLRNRALTRRWRLDLEDFKELIDQATNQRDAPLSPEENDGADDRGIRGL